ncbi:glyceraldehyde 3-phosphate dehydrogenase NAD-binding domain-containing protein [Pseudonocardia oroxyli]|uniref:Glyceraldehyde 3-phosphate dehydrogenase n=1 Tax=Pseudonocardia oroxyli TaxID=366584 RepID=A0A1G7E601_PSEOR|nr:glyceraldehyde 3-phosphate dehydrogenase NAD-binding domain-containing protein [Pseudonocardia oroxyli]SDE59148.1 glyceraldehyde 3-phosphate dehydrogenase [Pseudonocardia oroxyli]
MRARIGLDGMDRPGRQLLRTLVDRDDPDLQIVAVRDDAPASRLAARLRHDSTHGAWDHRIEVVGDHLGVDDGTIRVLRAERPHWPSADVEIVVATGRAVDAPVLLDEGVASVVVLGESADADLALVPGLNEDEYDATRHRVLSVPSAASVCAAAVLQPLDRAFGVVSASVTALGGRHSSTADPDDPRLLRDLAVNLVPAASRVGTEVGVLLPALAGRVTGAALRVPVVDTGLVEVTARLPAPATVGQLRRVLRTAADGPGKGLLTCTDEPTVSRDVLGAAESCRVDLGTVRTCGELVVVQGWHDPEVGHLHRVADLLGMVARLLPGR